jgi:diacylglycerol kinase family enzyme
MNIILNTNAAAGIAAKRWNSIKNIILKRFNGALIINALENVSVEKVIQHSIKTGDNNFIIAGGDGTVNYFVNKLVGVSDESEIKKIKIGVIGIGSSNDFCKPFDPESFVNNIPCKINFENNQLRDLGVLSYKSGPQFLYKYFLLNASIGVTAKANQLFNTPDLLLKFLKKHFTGLAILYSTLKTIFSYKNFEARIIFDSFETYSFRISNLSIIKNPNISGNLSYPGDPNYQNGLYDIYLTHSMNKLDLIQLLRSLSKKVFPKNDKTKYCRTSKIKVTAKNDFLIEFDGEIISTNYAEFTILNKYLNICAN